MSHCFSIFEIDSYPCGCFVWQVMRRICSSWAPQPSTLSGWSAPCSASPARASVLLDPARLAVSRDSQEMVPICKNQRYVGKRVFLHCISFSVTLVKTVTYVFLSYMQVSNKQRKEQQRLEKKKRQEERHRQKFLQSKGNQDQNLPDAVTLVPALNTLSI